MSTATNKAILWPIADEGWHKAAVTWPGSLSRTLEVLP